MKNVVNRASLGAKKNLIFKKIKWLLVPLVLLTLSSGNVWGAATLRQTITLEYTDSNPWSFPSSVTTPSTSYTNGGVTITLAGGGSGNGHKYGVQNISGGSKKYYLIMGKSGATLTLPTYTFKTTKIVVVGRSGASGSVKQNIYVGSTAVSDETTGATGTNTYNINSSYQAAGTTYVLKVTSAHNTQITSIQIWGEDASTTVSLTNGGCDGSGGTSKGSFLLTTKICTEKNENCENLHWQKWQKWQKNLHETFETLRLSPAILIRITFALRTS